VIGVSAARTALAARGGRAEVYIDLALPRDVDPAVAALPGVTVVDLERLGQHLAGESVAAQLDEVRELVAEEVSGYLSTQRAEAVAPTVVALRALAGSVVEAELARLSSRLGDVDERVRTEVRQTVHRVVEKLLHTPTVRVKELAGGPGGSSYAEALRELFGLDPARVSAVSRAPDQAGGNGSLPPAAGGQPAPPIEHAELVTGTAPIPAPSTAPLPAITTLRLGTRRSALATTQSRLVAGWIEDASVLTGRPVRVELVEITTAGDVSSAPLSSFGGVGVFVSALREALLDGRVDLAVHSLKDLPTAPAPGLTLAAVPQREAPNDVLVTADGRSLAELPEGARIGTGSPRRAAQLRAAVPGVKIVDIRGNVDTRLRLATEGELDAVVLALAGLRRLGWEGKVSEVLPPDLMLPAPGQGALGVECRADDETVLAALAPLEHPQTRAAVTAERALLARLEAGCAAPLGALAQVSPADPGDLLTLQAVVADVEAVVVLRRSVTGPADRPEELGHRLADELIADGAGRLVAAASPVAAACPSAAASLPSLASPPLAPDPPASGDGAAQTDRADRTDSGPAGTPAGEGDL
jgi:hydroxymethylbilane synthase